MYSLSCFLWVIVTQVGLLFFCDSTFVFVIPSVYTLVRLIHLTGGSVPYVHDITKRTAYGLCVVYMHMHIQYM